MIGLKRSACFWWTALYRGFEDPPRFRRGDARDGMARRPLNAPCAQAHHIL